MKDREPRGSRTIQGKFGSIDIFSVPKEIREQRAKEEVKADFHEDEHPRDESGEFSSEGGGGGRSRGQPGSKNRGLSYRVAPGHQMPRDGFEGERGNSLWVPLESLVGSADVRTALEASGQKGVAYRRGFPRLEPFIARASGANGRRVSSRVYLDFHGDRDKDFSEADAVYAQKLGWLKKNGEPDGRRVAKLRAQSELTWHHLEDCSRQKMILVPTLVHNAAHHTGGHSLCASK